MAGFNPPTSFKTDVHRAPTKKWADAKQYSYEGDDWGAYDEYNEYGTYDEPVPVPKHTGLRQRGQNITSAAQAWSETAVPAPGPAVSNTHTLHPRSSSFDAGDEQETFSTTVPAAQADSFRASREQHRAPLEQYRTTAQDHPDPANQYRQSGEQYRGQQTVQEETSTTRAASLSSQPSFHARVPSTTSTAAALADYQTRRDFSSSSAVPMPLSSRTPVASPETQSNELQRTNPFPPRKSSLSHAIPPDISSLAQVQQLQNHPMQSVSGPDSMTSKVSGAPHSGSPFIRPADIYKRMQEEKEKERERQVMEARRSSEEASERNIRSHPATSSVASPRDKSVSPARLESSQSDAYATTDEDPNTAKASLQLITERQSEYGLQGFSVGDPVLARALGANFLLSPTGSSPPPSLPQLNRVSMFNSDMFNIESGATREAQTPPTVSSNERNIASSSSERTSMNNGQRSQAEASAAGNSSRQETIAKAVDNAPTGSFDSRSDWQPPLAVNPASRTSFDAAEDFDQQSLHREVPSDSVTGGLHTQESQFSSAKPSSQSPYRPTAVASEADPRFTTTSFPPSNGNALLYDDSTNANTVPVHQDQELHVKSTADGLGHRPVLAQELGYQVDGSADDNGRLFLPSETHVDGETDVVDTAARTDNSAHSLTSDSNQDAGNELPKSLVEGNITSMSFEDGSYNVERSPERTESPSRSKVRTLAGRYDDLTLSAQTTATSPTDSVASWTSRTRRSPSPTKAAIVPVLNVPVAEAVGSSGGGKASEYFAAPYARPRLPGEWISYAESYASNRQSETISDEDDEEVPEDEATPKGSGAQSPLPESPKTTHGIAHLDTSPDLPHSSESSFLQNTAEDPLEALRNAGHAIAESVMATMGFAKHDHESSTSEDDVDGSTATQKAGIPIRSHAYPQHEAVDVSDRTSDSDLRQYTLPDDGASTPSVVGSHEKGGSGNETAEFISQYGDDHVDRTVHAVDRTVDREDNINTDEEHETLEQTSRLISEFDHSSRDQNVSATPSASYLDAGVSQRENRTNLPEMENAIKEDAPSATLSDAMAESGTKNDIVLDADQREVQIGEQPHAELDLADQSSNEDLTENERLSREIVRSLTPARGTSSTVPKENYAIASDTLSPASDATFTSRESTLLPREYDSYWAESRHDHEETDRASGEDISPSEVDAEAPRQDPYTQGLGEEAITSPSEFLGMDRATKPNVSSTPSTGLLGKRFSWECIDESTNGATGAKSERSHDAANIAADPPPLGIRTADLDRSVGADPLRFKTPISPVLTGPYFHSGDAGVREPPGDTSQIEERKVNQRDASPDREDSIVSPITETPRTSNFYDNSVDRTPGIHADQDSSSTPVTASLFMQSENAIPQTVLESSSERYRASATHAKLTSFKDILAIKQPHDRIDTYSKTRDEFATMRTGLDDWLSSMLAARPELARIEPLQTKHSMTGGITGSVLHKISPSISKLTRSGGPVSLSTQTPYYQQYLDSAPKLSGHGPTDVSAMRYSEDRLGTRALSGTGPSDGKEAGGKGAFSMKGLLAKGKSKLKGGSSEKTTSPSRSSSSGNLHQNLHSSSQQSRRTSSVTGEDQPPPSVSSATTLIPRQFEETNVHVGTAISEDTPIPAGYGAAQIAPSMPVLPKEHLRPSRAAENEDQVAKENQMTSRLSRNQDDELDFFQDSARTVLNDADKERRETSASRNEGVDRPGLGPDGSIAHDTSASVSNDDVDEGLSRHWAVSPLTDILYESPTAGMTLYKPFRRTLPTEDSFTDPESGVSTPFLEESSFGPRGTALWDASQVTGAKNAFAADILAQIQAYEPQALEPQNLSGSHRSFTTRTEPAELSGQEERQVERSETDIGAALGSTSDLRTMRYSQQSFSRSGLGERQPSMIDYDAYPVSPISRPESADLTSRWKALPAPPRSDLESTGTASTITQGHVRTEFQQPLRPSSFPLKESYSEESSLRPDDSASQRPHGSIQGSVTSRQQLSIQASSHRPSEPMISELDGDALPRDSIAADDSISERALRDYGQSPQLESSTESGQDRTDIHRIHHDTHGSKMQLRINDDTRVPTSDLGTNPRSNTTEYEIVGLGAPPQSSSLPSLKKKRRMSSFGRFRSRSRSRGRNVDDEFDQDVPPVPQAEKEGVQQPEQQAASSTDMIDAAVVDAESTRRRRRMSSPFRRLRGRSRPQSYVEPESQTLTPSTPLPSQLSSPPWRDRPMHEGKSDPPIRPVAPPIRDIPVPEMQHTTMPSHTEALPELSGDSTYILPPTPQQDLVNVKTRERSRSRTRFFRRSNAMPALTTTPTQSSDNDKKRRTWFGGLKGCFDENIDSSDDDFKGGRTNHKSLLMDTHSISTRPASQAFTQKTITQDAEVQPLHDMENAKMEPANFAAQGSIEDSQTTPGRPEINDRAGHLEYLQSQDIVPRRPASSGRERSYRAELPGTIDQQAEDLPGPSGTSYRPEHVMPSSGDPGMNKLPHHNNVRRDAYNDASMSSSLEAVTPDVSGQMNSLPPAYLLPSRPSTTDGPPAPDSVISSIYSDSAPQPEPRGWPVKSKSTSHYRSFSTETPPIPAGKQEQIPDWRRSVSAMSQLASPISPSLSFNVHDYLERRQSGSQARSPVLTGPYVPPARYSSPVPTETYTRLVQERRKGTVSPGIYVPPSRSALLSNSIQESGVQRDGWADARLRVQIPALPELGRDMPVEPPPRSPFRPPSVQSNLSLSGSRPLSPVLRGESGGVYELGDGRETTQQHMRSMSATAVVGQGKPPLRLETSRMDRRSGAGVSPGSGARGTTSAGRDVRDGGDGTMSPTSYPGQEWRPAGIELE